MKPGRKAKPSHGRVCSKCGREIRGPNYFFCPRCENLIGKLQHVLEGNYIYESSEIELNNGRIQRKIKAKETW